MSTILEEMKAYFEATPREQVLKEWAESSKFDDVGPTIEEFLNQEWFIVNPIPSELNTNAKLNTKQRNPELFSGFLISNDYENITCCFFN